MQKINKFPRAWTLLTVGLLCLFCFSVCFSGCKEKELSKKIYFVFGGKKSFEIKPVERKFSPKNKIKDSIMELLKGPNQEEIKNDYRSEIPEGTRLLSFIETPQKIEINLSKEFKSGGGTRSMYVRFQQISQTIAQFKNPKDIYLLIEGKELLVLGGEGFEVQSPISVAKNKTQKNKQSL